MTIFQKMILAPVISLILYVGFITFSLFEHQNSGQKVQALNENYVPILQLVNENVLLFEKLRDSFKDAVLANELSWLGHTLTIKNTLNSNLVNLESYPDILPHADVKKTQENIGLYYKNAKMLAHTILANDDSWQGNDRKIQQVEHYLNTSYEQLLAMKKNVQTGFRLTLTEIKQLHKRLLFWASIIAISSMLFLITVTLIVSLSTRRSLYQLVEKAKALALGSTDFSQRIERHSKDELSKLVFWFNKLSDKLEKDYVEVKNISITDKLTQLNNRTRTDQFLPKVINTALSEGNTLFITIVDIDHFKQVNDNFGHLTGDKVLQTFAEILKKHSTQSDYISRWGGEEFLLIWSNITSDEALQKANHLREDVASMHFNDVGTVTISMGVTEVLATDIPQTILTRADQHLYQAKDQGRNRVVFDDITSPINSVVL